MTVRIGFVHALRDSMRPCDAALTSIWPRAEAAHLLDGSLYLDRSRGNASEEVIAARVAALVRHSASCGTAGILFTGSFFGAQVEAVRPSLDIPILTSFDGLVREACEAGRRFHVLATAPSSVDLLRDDLGREAVRRGIEIEVTGAVVEGGMDALQKGDHGRHVTLIANAAARAPACDAVLLAQFSMAPAREASAVAAPAPVMTAPEAGVRRLRSMLGAARA